MNKIAKVSALALACSLVLTGCPFDSDDDLPPATSNPGTVTLSGTATKGVLGSATVVGCLVTSSTCTSSTLTAADFGAVGESPVTGQVGTTQLTNADGSYSLDLGSAANGLPVLVRIFATSATTVECDFTGCNGGAGQDLPVNFELQTVQLMSDPSNNTLSSNTANVSALSTIAAEAFVESVSLPTGKLTASEFEAAQKVVSDSVASVLGLNTAVTGGTVNLFDLQVPTANASTLSGVQDQTVDGLTVPAALVQELALFNASFGAIGVKDGNLDAVTNSVANVVKKRSNNETVSDADLGDLKTKIGEVKAEAAAQTTAVNNDPDTDLNLSEPTVADPDDIVDNSNNTTVDIPDVTPSDPDPTGGTGGGNEGSNDG
ncbi:hypothetical protein [Thaumasiovibrio subtropicus]|uniref:hypothetical protein n=1 Tax=Thaumasiovibrio subtropicus TaxID=1891207 RepID=UPI000B35FB77|nr:hypothetical protein [Thaumasiovibrio subtropicus]